MKKTPINSEIQAKMAKVNAVVFDFDGVFTNNKVIVSEDGLESVVCDRSDGLGVANLRAANFKLLILSTETNSVVKTRAKKLKIPVEQGCEDKAAFLKTWMLEAGVDPEAVAFVGNDTNDLGAMALAGLSIVPCDANITALRQADLVLRNAGGKGAVREVSDLLLLAV